MLLTGKAKKYFEIWMSDQGVSGIDICNFEYSNFKDLSYPSQYAIFVSWFDSVGIYLEIFIWHRDEYNMYFGWNIGDYDGWIYSHDKLKAMDRTEATKQAIIKANELYNQRNNNQD